MGVHRFCCAPPRAAGFAALVFERCLQTPPLPRALRSVLFGEVPLASAGGPSASDSLVSSLSTERPLAGSVTADPWFSTFPFSFSFSGGRGDHFFGESVLRVCLLRRP